MLYDRRRSARHSSGLEGTVKVSLRQSLQASVTNISTFGAMLEIDRFENVPQKFKLEIGDFETTCFVRHRDKRVIGVEFETAYEGAEVGTSAHIPAAELAAATAAWRG